MSFMESYLYDHAELLKVIRDTFIAIIVEEIAKIIHYYQS